MSTAAGPIFTKNNIRAYYDLSNPKSFSGLPTTNQVRIDNNFIGTQYATDNEWTSEPTQIIKTYDSSIITPVGTGATLITESGNTGYHHLSRFGGSGEDFIQSISCFIRSLVPITEFWIGMLNSTGKGVSFNLSTKTINSESVTNNNYFIYEVDGYPGWIRIGANIEGRFGGWVGAIGYSMLSYTGVSGEKACYVTGLQHEYTPMPTEFIKAQQTRSSTVAGGGGVRNLIQNTNNSDINGTGLITDRTYKTGIRFTGTDGQSLNFGNISYGNNGFKEATINYWFFTNTSGVWNNFGAGGPGYYYAINPANNLIMMVSAKDSLGTGVNFWPECINVSSLIIGKPCMVTITMKEDSYARWYVNGQRRSESLPPNFSYLRFYDGNFRAGQGYATTGTQFTGTIYSAMSYDKALSDTEILEIFNATRGRYGI